MKLKAIPMPDKLAGFVSPKTGTVYVNDKLDNSSLAILLTKIKKDTEGNDLDVSNKNHRA